LSAVFTASDTTTITYADTGSFAEVCQFRLGDDEGDETVAAPEYGRDYPAVAGVDGTGTIDYGYRGQHIEISAVYVAATLNGVLSAIQGDMEKLSAGPSTLVMDGQTYYACEIDGQASGKRGPTKSTGLGYYMSFARIVVTAKRDSA